MAIGWHRATKIRINLKAIQENVHNEIKRMPENTELFAVVKANGYGHGAIETAKAAKKGGATGFCVALLDEAIELREAGITEPILILGLVDTTYIELLIKYQLSVTVTTQEWIEQAAEQLQVLKPENPLQIHIKIDTGMGRLGFLTKDDVLTAALTVENDENILWEGIYTHFSTADEPDTTYFEKQNHRFVTILKELPRQPRYVHVGNSATELWHPNTIGNMIRYGIAMYGLNPSGRTLEPTYELKPVLSLVSELIHVKQIPAGEGIGYGKTYTTSKEEWIGVIPIGYADGWLRHMQGFSVLIGGEYCEIVGRVCMDQCMVRLPHQMSVGAVVTLIGKDNNQEITTQMVAEKLDTINYEVVCSFSHRLPREYQ